MDVNVRKLKNLKKLLCVYTHLVFYTFLTRTLYIIYMLYVPLEDDLVSYYSSPLQPLALYQLKEMKLDVITNLVGLEGAVWTYYHTQYSLTCLMHIIQRNVLFT